MGAIAVILVVGVALYFLLVRKSATATSKLVGTDDAIGNNGNANVLSLSKHKAVASGTLTEIRVKAGVPSEVKVAVYTSSKQGFPNSRLTHDSDGQQISKGWNSLKITPINIIAGTTYFLGMIARDTGGRQVNSGLWRVYKAADYSTFTFPNTITISELNLSRYHSDLIAGWGVPSTTQEGG